jgi:hypothetical protein
MTPFPCSDHGPRGRLLSPNSSQPSLSIACTLLFISPSTHETTTASKRRCSASLTTPGLGLFLSPSNTSCWEGPTSDQRARNLLPSHQNRSISRSPFPDPLPGVVITMIRMALKDAIISIPGPWLGLGPSSLPLNSLPRAATCLNAASARAETLARCWWRPGRRKPGTNALSLLDVVTG